jgi:hypothetical protein
MNMHNNWWRDLVEESAAEDELGTGELIEHLAEAIESEGYDDVYDDIMNRRDDAFPPDHPMHGIRAGRRGQSAPNLRIRGIDPLGPRFTANPGHLVIIPGEEPVACTPLALTLINSRRSRWRHQRPGSDWEHHDDLTRESSRQAEWRRWVMMRMKTHVICCAAILRRMVVLVDHWDPQVFEQEHARELSAWHHHGIRFAFLLVTRQKGLSPLRVKL